MNRQVLQEKGQFQLAFRGGEFCTVNNELLMPERTINLSGTYRIRLSGVQATLPWTGDNAASINPESANNGFPLMLITSPQFTQILTPDLPGPVVQWGNQFMFAPLYQTGVVGACLTHSSCYAGDILGTEYVALIHNRIQLQLRCNPSTATTVAAASYFNQTLLDAFGINYFDYMSFIFTFYYERV